MRKYFFRAIGLLVVVMLMTTIVLSGCQSKNQVDQKNSQQEAQNSENTDNKKQESAKQEKVKITFWHNYGADKETPYFAETIIPKFREKFPNIDVEVVAQGSDQYQQLIITAMGTKTTPDVARVDLTHVAGFAKQGALVALDDMEGFNELKGKLFEGPLSSNLYQGKYYGLPLDTNCKAAVFNMKNLQKLGLNEIPKTMEEFIEASKKNSKGKYTLNVSSAGEWDILTYFWLFGGVLSDEGFTKTTGYLDSKQSIEALNRLVALHEDKVLTIKEIDGTADAWDGIKTDEYAMFFEGPWFFAFNSDWKKNGLAPGLIPTVEGKTASIVGGEDIVMFKNTKHPKEAFEFMKFLLSEEVQVLMGVNMGQMPVLKSAAENAEFKKNEVWSVYLEQLKSAKTRIPSPQKSTIEQYIKDAFEPVLRGKVSAEESLKKYAKLIDEELSK
ncbi:MAG: hypothetical protein JG777_2273 [Clostridia bacterium]|jgi:multiple sugar transport system substrate-binding protein|nr:hypothetical protein [Clostridia bacterium]